jgi:transcriptional regulator with XRE-family HTH domain
MTYPAYLRDRARRLRIDNQLTLDEIAERLALSRGTIWSWISDLRLNRPRQATAGAALGTAAMQAKYRKLREDAYAQGLAEFDRFNTEPTFRDFVVLYIAEGYKRNRNRVSIGNSDPKVVGLSARWMARLASRPLTFSVQYHVDQDLEDLRSFWGALLGVEPTAIRLQRKSNSGQLAGRHWRSQYGVLTVTACDTLLRARLQAWIDRLRGDWSVDSQPGHGA